MNFALNFLEHDVSIAEDTWTALVTTGSDTSLANVRATMLGVLERNGTFTIEDSNDQAVRRIERLPNLKASCRKSTCSARSFNRIRRNKKSSKLAW